jgi:hypothetical protein
MRDLVRARQVMRSGLWIVVLAACACSGPAGPSKGETQSTTIDDGFRLHVLSQGWDQLLPRKYTLEDSWSVLSAVSLQGALIITADDVATYDWARQLVTLTEVASQRLMDAFSSPSQGYPWSVALNQRCFVVTLDGKRLYGGVLMHPASALGVDFPVIYYSTSGAPIVFSMLPSTRWDVYESFPPSEKSRIALPEIHDYFAALGKLTE